MRFSTRKLALASLFILSTAPGVQAQDGFMGFGGNREIPTLNIVPADIAIDVPMPVNSANMALLLAQAGKGHDLSSMKDAALRKYHQHLQRELSTRLSEFFADEEVPLVDGRGMLSLENRLNIKVIKHLSDLQSEGDYDLEKGTVELSGIFYFRLHNYAGETLLEQSFDIAGLKISEKYQLKSPRDGGTPEDTTEAAIKRALDEMVEKILKRIDGDLEADELQDLAFG